MTRRATTAYLTVAVYHSLLPFLLIREKLQVWNAQTVEILLLIKCRPLISSRNMEDRFHEADLNKNAKCEIFILATNMIPLL